MQLDTVTTALRPRNPWEAIDLGFALARHWLKPLYLAWFAVLIPLTLLLHVICIQVLWLVPWLIWWLKPLLDRVPLYVLSRTLFGETPTVRQVFRALPGLLSRQALSALTLARLDPARSFHLPVRQLEGLHGRARRKRQRVLNGQEKSAATWLTVTCIHLEMAANFALLGLVWLMLPDFVELDIIDLLTDASAFQQLWLNLVGLCGLSLIEPFYVAGGFALYLNRRIWLEAWDIEIGFRRLARRLEKAGAASAAVLAIVLGLGMGDRALAEPVALAISPACQQFFEQRDRLEKAAGEVKRTLAEVLQEDELQRCETRQVWRFKGDREVKRPARRDSALGAWLAAALESLLWVALLAFLVLVLRWLLTRAASPLPARRLKSVGRGPPPQQGQESPLAMPAAGTGAEVWNLWTAGRQREALGLLYRSSLAGLSGYYGIRFEAGATEEECLGVARARLPERQALLDFLGRVTRAWQTVAYAHRLPAAPEVRGLCEQWPIHFSAS